jgi:hypothetical protein
MKGENQPLVTDEPVEVEKQPIEVQDFGEEYRSFLRNLWNILQISQGNLEHKFTTCNQLDLETLGI